MSIEKWLAEVEAREKAATEGPWTLDKDWSNRRIWAPDEASFHSNGKMRTHPRGPSSASFTNCITETNNDCSLPEPKANMNFIAHSRQDIPRLLRIVERLQNHVGHSVRCYTGVDKMKCVCGAKEALEYTGLEG